jgi:uncharacterized damage-inducible protein DinB
VTRSPLADAFGHHIWATLQILDACEPLTSEQLDATVVGIYGSLITTLRHLVASDRSYLELLSEGAVEEVDEETLDLAAMRAVIEENGPIWQEVIAGDIDPERIVVRRRDDGSTSSAPLGVRLAQVTQHGTDHRSQICTVLTSLGIQPPEIDVWDYAEVDGRLGQTPPTDSAAG